MKAPELEEIFEITATLNPHYMEGGRLMAMINGGDVTGKIKGKVLPVGGEFGIFISADTYKIDVRAAIQAEDGSIYYILNKFGIQPEHNRLITFVLMPFLLVFIGVRMSKGKVTLGF